jgi:hypothetical protein
VPGIARVHHDAAHLGHMAAQLRRQLHHLRREGAHGGDEPIGTRMRAQHHAAGWRAGDGQRAIGQGGIRIGRHLGLQAQRARVIDQRLRAGALRDAIQSAAPPARRQRPAVRAALHAGAHDQHRPGPVGRQPARGQGRHGGGAPRGDGGAVQDQAPRAAGHVEHRHVALDGGRGRADVGGVKLISLVMATARRRPA